MRLILLISILSISSALGAVNVKGVERNLFDALMMSNYKTGMTKVCASDQKCVVSVSKVLCSLDVEGTNKDMGKKGSCTFKNRSGEFGVLYNDDAFKLAQQLIVYGANYRNNGAEVKISVSNAICAGTKNAQGQFAKRCQLQ